MSILHFEMVGQGEDLVLLHGWALNLRVWDGLVAQLRDHFRVITIDLPGHGRTPWRVARTPAEQAWLIHQTLESISQRYSLLGWSLGAQMALDLAAATPAQIERLVLVAATAKFAAGSDWPHGAAPETLTGLANQLRVDPEGTVSDFLELQVRGSAAADTALSQLRRALLLGGQPSRAALAAGLQRLACGDLRATLAHVRAPTLVIGGQYDRVTSPAASRALAEALPDARYIEMSRAAHAPFLSHTHEFAALVKDFVRPERIEQAAASVEQPAATSPSTRRPARSAKRRAPTKRRAAKRVTKKKRKAVKPTKRRIKARANTVRTPKARAPKARNPRKARARNRRRSSRK